MKNKIIKSITLIVFSTLIISFIAYRAGYLNDIIFNSSTNLPEEESSENSTQNDSAKKIEFMSSSKTIIMQDHPILSKDSTKMKMDSIVMQSFISSSKSGLILKPKDLKKTTPDAIVTDSLKK
ncbi:hypothetical protein [uncultured Tenacibaculum sp.]|uniref:hypothetical protein n=1 Tax=uncultured Tenacibaculum sp. TaxID=174713 RepID=UPI00261D0E6D|nr:hypothetical protein [uncultured Tenacibaculum sp.]